MPKIKQLLPLLFALISLLAFTATVHSSDVNLSPTTIPGFNAANLPADVSLSGVSVTFNSPTVTCSSCFRQQWVGLGGFRIAIEGTPYTVAHVTSRSALTLATPYAGGDSANASVLWYKYVELRIYADSSFQPAGKTYIVQPGSPGSGAWHKRVAASVVNELGTNNLYIPQLTLDATTDSPTNQAARYYAAFYRPEGGLIQAYDCFDSFALAPTSSTTWPDVCTFNQQQVIVQDSSTYTKQQIDAMRTGCTTGQSLFYAATGLKPSCLNIGTGPQIVGDTISATAGSSYTTVLNNGTPLTQRSVLNFSAPGLVASDNGGASRTDVTLDSDLNALASNSTNGFWARTGAGTGAARTLTGTANEIAVANGDGSGVPTFSLPAALTFSGKTITGGIYGGITNLGIRSTGSGAFDLQINNTENLTANRALTVTLNDASRTFSLGGNLTTGGAFTTGSTFSTTGAFSTAGAFTTAGANALTLTTTGGTNVTLPTTGTLATLAGTETFSNKTLSSPRVTTGLFDSNGNESILTPATASAVNEITVTNAATGSAPSVTATGGDTNINFRLAGKGTGRVVIPGYAYTLEVNSTATGNVTTGLDNLQSYSLPAGSLAANGDFLTVTYAGSFATNDNDKRILVTFAGQTTLTAGSAALDIDSGHWSYQITYVRLSATSVFATTDLMWGALVRDSAGTETGNCAFATQTATLTVANLDSNASTLLVQAEGTATNDIVRNLSLIRLVQR